jgi:hypothetical protein
MHNGGGFLGSCICRCCTSLSDQARGLGRATAQVRDTFVPDTKIASTPRWLVLQIHLPPHRAL